MEERQESGHSHYYHEYCDETSSSNGHNGSRMMVRHPQHPLNVTVAFFVMIFVLACA
jgi:hypothetical protein